MLSTLKSGMICAAVGLFIPIATAQQPAAIPAAPVPSQILRAKRIFIVNAEGDNDVRISKYVGGTNGIYDQFYADVNNLGRFALVSAPADADRFRSQPYGICRCSRISAIPTRDPRSQDKHSAVDHVGTRRQRDSRQDGSQEHRPISCEIDARCLIADSEGMKSGTVH
jgi:hypothetical protein